jgi:phosphate transport system substrate-binding protein
MVWLSLQLNFLRFLFFIIACMSGGITFSEAAFAGDDPDLIKIAGSTTVLPIASRVAETLNAKQNHPLYTVNAGGSGVGVHGVGRGLIQLGLISRSITEAELKRYSNVDLNVYLVGRDAVACVVSSEIYNSGVKSLSRQQIQNIYLGKIRNWKKVGGPDRQIVVIDKEMHRGTRHVFMEYVFGRQNARAPGARLVTGSNNEEQTKIAKSDAAIGMLSFAWINEEVIGVAIRDESNIIEPNLQNIQNETYPIMRDLSLVTAGKPVGPVKDFISFVLGPVGQTIVREAGYVPTDAFQMQKIALPNRN